jgi:hypothetical protein
MPAVWLRSVVAVVLALGLIAVVLYQTSSREDPLARIKRQIQDEIPIGATQEEVKAWTERMGGSPPSFHSWAPVALDENAPKCLPEVSGLERADLAAFAEIRMPWGSYTANDQFAANHLWIFLPLDEDGRVKGWYFMTLADLAEYEKARAAAKR